MGIPKNCSHCTSSRFCNSAMYSKGCHYFPPNSEKKKNNANPLMKFFGKFFK